MAADERNWREEGEAAPVGSEARPVVKDVVKSIRLTDDPEEIDYRTDGIKDLVLRTEFVKTR